MFRQPERGLKLLEPDSETILPMADPLISHSSKPLLPLWMTTSALVVLSVIAVPLFVCSPVTSDTSLFDVQAMTVLKGGILYRDVLEPNLPGIVWVHIGLRTLIGWSSEAIRTADLAIFALTMFLFVQLVQSTRRNTAGGPMATAVVCCFSVLSDSQRVVSLSARYLDAASSWLCIVVTSHPD